MFVVDTNILLYAVNTDCAEHERCREFLEQCRAGSGRWYLTWSIAYEFLRVSTHPRVFPAPLKPKAAWAFLEALFASPSLRMLSEGPDHREVLAATFEEMPELRANLVHDGHTAVLMREHGVERIFTRDVDFGRFRFVEMVDPLRALVE